MPRIIWILEASQEAGSVGAWAERVATVWDVMKYWLGVQLKVEVCSTLPWPSVGTPEFLSQGMAGVGRDLWRSPGPTPAPAGPPRAGCRAPGPGSFGTPLSSGAAARGWWSSSSGLFQPLRPQTPVPSPTGTLFLVLRHCTASLMRKICPYSWELAAFI